MDDREITKACALAIGTEVGPVPNVNDKLTYLAGNRFWLTYDPLHDDAQCFALVKRFGLCISRLSETWYVDASDDGDAATADHPTDLNRAICLCVARLPAAQQPEGQK